MLYWVLVQEASVRRQGPQPSTKGKPPASLTTSEGFQEEKKCQDTSQQLTSWC